MSELIGYFDSNSDVAAYDPGKSVDCVVCGAPLIEPIRAHSFMAEHGMRSYFVRTHAACDPSEFIGNAVDEVIGK